MASPEQPEIIIDIVKTHPQIELILKLSKNIIEAVNENKSVTAKNKQQIRVAAEEIQKVSTALQTDFPYTAPQTTSCEDLQSLKQDIIAGVSLELKKLTDNINKQTPSYAAITKTLPVPKLQKPGIIVTPNEPTGNEKTLDTWREQISFKNLKFAPSKVKPIAKGRIFVEFENNHQCEEIIKAVNNTKKLQAEEVKRRPPLVILKGISNKTDKEELIDIISFQNSIPAEALRLCFLTNNRNQGLYNAVLEVRPSEYTKILGLERVAVDHQRVFIGPFSRFVQCRQCLQFGHTKTKCTSEIKPCAHCASTDHQIDTCPLKEQKDKALCYNCTKHHNKNSASSQANAGHAANNINKCPIIQAIKTKIEEATNYGP